MSPNLNLSSPALFTILSFVQSTKESTCHQARYKSHNYRNVLRLPTWKRPQLFVGTNDMDARIDVEASGELDSICFKEVIDQDSRPAFVLDLGPDGFTTSKDLSVLVPAFCNFALRSHDRLLDVVTGQTLGDVEKITDTPTYEDFKSWATSITRFDDSRDVFPTAFTFSGILWTGSTIQKRWRLISGNFQTCKVAPNGSFIHPFNDVADAGSHAKERLDSPSSTKRSSLKRPLPLMTEVQPHRSSDSPEGTLTTETENCNLVVPDQRQVTNVSKPRISSRSSKNTGNSGSTASLNLSVPEKGISDWTIPNPKGHLSKHHLLARSIDWDSTPLGSMASWSAEFRQIANLLMQNPHPAALFWGPDLTMLYNEAYAAEVAGNKHPALIGTGFSGPFSELWDGVEPIFIECARTGISIRKENHYLPMERSGYLEETYFSWSFSPIYGGGTKILGFYNAPFDTTKQVVNQRRLETINLLGEKVALARTIKEFWKCVLDGLKDNHFDVPFALIYSVAEGDEDETYFHGSESTMSLKSYFFEGSIGVPPNHSAAPSQLDLKRGKEGFIPSFREAMRTREPTLIRTVDGTLPEALLEGINWRGFGDPCQEAIIFPVRPTNGETVLAFLLIGVNPRKAYDDDYKIFTATLNRQLATSLASVMLYEGEVRRGKMVIEEAAIRQKHLTIQLEEQTSRMRRMTEFSPLGMFLYNADGTLLEANDRYYEMTGLHRESIDEKSFKGHVSVDSIETMNRGWHTMIVEGQPWSGELQLIRPSTYPLNVDAEPIDYWVLITAQPDFNQDGSVKSITGSMSDISHQKWAQGLQDRRLQEADETRRKQNDFIDITSHEMRNPMSAILQCADDISTSLQRTGASPTSIVIKNCIEAANTIVLCVQHQKSIVDDILTVSKLDSNLVVITPSPVQPITLLKRALKIFDAEFKAKDIKVELMLHPSIQEQKIDWILLDQNRLLQILINLISNAVKFTFTSPKRSISVHIGASSKPPIVRTPDFYYIPMKHPKSQLSFSEDLGPGETVHLRFKVQDTGCGLSADEKERLFQRFSQANPRTHGTYGGSGLGLFISRQLAELHGGQIGVASEAGVGSTFGFYVETRRIDAPKSDKATELPSALTQNIGWPPSIPERRSSDAKLQFSVDQTQTGPVQQSARAQGLHILVVEDNLVNQRVLKRQLQQYSCVTSVANNGLEAIAHLETTVFCDSHGGIPLDVILMDLEMPEMDGLTCVAEIRKMEVQGLIGGHVPVVAVTANVRDEQVAAAMATGMDDVISKPFRIPELLGKVRKLLTKLEDG